MRKLAVSLTVGLVFGFAGLLQATNIAPKPGERTLTRIEMAKLFGGVDNACCGIAPDCNVIGPITPCTKRTMFMPCVLADEEHNTAYNDKACVIPAVNTGYVCTPTPYTDLPPPPCRYTVDCAWSDVTGCSASTDPIHTHNDGFINTKECSDDCPG